MRQTDSLSLSIHLSLPFSLFLSIYPFVSLVYLIFLPFFTLSCNFAMPLSIFLNVCLYVRTPLCQKSSGFLCRKKQAEENIQCLNKESGQSKPKFLGKEIGNFVVAQLLYDYFYIISIIRPTITYMVFYRDTHNYKQTNGPVVTSLQFWLQMST